jgi:hypothetical protein
LLRRLAIETEPDADTRSTRQQGLAIGLVGISRTARARNTRKPLNGRHGRRGRRIPASAPFRPSGLRGETVSVFRVLTRVSAGYFGNAPRSAKQHFP